MRVARRWVTGSLGCAMPASKSSEKKPTALGSRSSEDGGNAALALRAQCWWEGSAFFIEQQADTLGIGSEAYRAHNRLGVT